MKRGFNKTELARATRANPLGIVGLGLVLIVIIVAALAPTVATHDPKKLNRDDTLLEPSSGHFFGTDVAGRDVFSRVVFGSRTSLRVAATVMAIALTIGGVMGTIAGYAGGFVSESLMRVTDIFLSFPSLILALAINAALGPGLNSAIIAVGITLWPAYARLIRAQVLANKNNLYVVAARSLGAGHIRLLFKHVIPSCVGPLIVQSTLDVGYVVLAVAGLSFLGIGAQPPTSEWGYMVGQAQKNLMSAWWWATFPGLAICMFVVGFNLLGDFLRDLLDPLRSST